MDERLIEVAFPLKQTSLDSVHEKNVRHGHISTLHIWPARRPLAACRAALIATLLPDPGNTVERKELLERLGGRVVQRVKPKKLPGGRIEEQITEETESGILHWGRESSEDLSWFREKICAAYGGRSPKVLDPFAGGGAIPLEAMRLGCEVTAVDINPVAWFILKCTLEYPQRLANQRRPLPAFACESYEFMESYFKAKGFKDAALRVQLESLSLNGHKQSSSQPQLPAIQTHFASVEADLAWHVRAWGWWVLQKARADLARFYPTVDGKPTVAYLWARTVTCKNCRATIPLLKTRWLCKKENKRVVLTMRPNADKTGVVFGVQVDVPSGKGSNAQRRDYDKQIGNGTMSRSGATCPCCGTIMTKEDIQQESLKGRLSVVMTTVVIDGSNGKEYRLPTPDEIQLALQVHNEQDETFAQIPFGLPTESLTLDAKGNTWCILYGMDTFQKLFTSRQLLALGNFIKHARAVRDAMSKEAYPSDWIEAVSCFLACVIGKMLDYENAGCSWYTQNEQITHLFNRFVLPIKWDFAETSPIGGASGSWVSMLHSVSKSVDTAVALPKNMMPPYVLYGSATAPSLSDVDVVITDPPYYDAIGYAVVMDFFYVWLRRILFGLSAEMDAAFQQPLSPKWDYEHNDGELIDDSNRFGGDKVKSKAVYEDGMFRAFQACYKSLSTDGRLVIVFAHKQPDAWETLVSAIIRAGFVVDGSWPIQTEMGNRTRALSSAALSSSVWLVCKKRPETAKPGWDNQVLQEMQAKITHRLHDFWDAGIRGPDFVWAATGPALEAYSEHPVVKKSNEPGKVLSVSEFLRHVRRMVVDFVVGRVLSHNGGQDAVSGLDDVTTYYLLHRYDFGRESAPIGPCILYAVSCNLSDAALTSRYDLLARTGV
jgi:putative DNA methylase